MNKLTRLKSYANTLNCSAYTLRNLKMNENEEKQLLEFCKEVRNFKNQSYEYQEENVRKIRDAYYSLSFIPEDVIDILWEQYSNIFYIIDDKTNYFYKEGIQLEDIKL